LVFKGGSVSGDFVPAGIALAGVGVIWAWYTIKVQADMGGFCLP